MTRLLSIDTDARTPLVRNVARIVHVEELTGERCVACGHPAETSVGLETPKGVVLQGGRRATTARLCRRCAKIQDSIGRVARIDMVFAAVPPVAGVVAGFLVGTRDGIATTLGVLLGISIVVFARHLMDRERARTTPVLLLEAEGDRVVLQLSIPERGSVSAGTYRSAPDDPVTNDELVRPLPPRRRLGLAWPSGIAISGIVVLLGWSGSFERYSVVLIDAPTRPVSVALDGDAFELPAGGRALRRLRAGEHTFEIVYLDTREVVRGELTSSATRGVLLATESEQCYSVWMYGKAPAPHSYGSAYWAEVDIPKHGYERISCAPPEPTKDIWRPGAFEEEGLSMDGGR